MKVVSQTDDLVVIQLDELTGDEILKKGIVHPELVMKEKGKYVIPTHILVYNDRIEIKVEELCVPRARKTRKFALKDLLLMHWVLHEIMEK
jgi:hypothetical protein